MRQATILAGIFFLACAIELTAVIRIPRDAVFIAVAYRRIASAVTSGVIFTFALAAFSAILYRLYGRRVHFSDFRLPLSERPRTVGRYRGGTRE